MVREQQKIQLELAFTNGGRGEAPRNPRERVELTKVKGETQSSAKAEQLMEEVCQRGNMLKAWEKVRKNKGGPGVDGMTIDELTPHLKENWERIKEELLKGKYKPQPIKRVEIPKPGGGKRKLGIPTVLDRCIQQALLQKLQGEWDSTFSEFSYGFRPQRSAHQAIAQAQKYISEGYRYTVDIDLEKFFDKVNHDKLMGEVAKRVKDKRILKLIRAFLTSGIMEGGLVSQVNEGTPQGGPLSPLLSNLVLDKLDQELERRGHRFCRYADDCNIYVRSERAGKRVMESIEAFITKKLRLKVNRKKSAVDKAYKRSFLGFSFTSNKSNPKRRISNDSKNKFKDKIKKTTGRSRRVSMKQILLELSRYLRGWRAYFGFCETITPLKELDAWLRRRLRSMIAKQWRTRRKILRELYRRGVPMDTIRLSLWYDRKPWALSKSKAFNMAFPQAYFDSVGLPRLEARRCSSNRNRRVRDPYARWCERENP